MSASLVGSEMCIRDRSPPARLGPRSPPWAPYAPAWPAPSAPARLGPRSPLRAPSAPARPAPRSPPAPARLRP
eukprot:6134601-Alexandrium_andersonii.AAC.1